MEVTYFRSPVLGTELKLEKTVLSSIPKTFGLNSQQTWIAASAPIGAGRPDLVIVSYRPGIFLLPKIDPLTTEILAYLFSVQEADLATIQNCLNKAKNPIESRLDILIKANVIREKTSGYSLKPSWRSTLPTIIAIEVKVSNWQKAVQQAARNRTLAHQSFIAIPKNISKRAEADPLVKSMGLGIVEVDQNNNVRILKKSRKSKPRVPSYYFKLTALLIAQ